MQQSARATDKDISATDALEAALTAKSVFGMTVQGNHELVQVRLRPHKRMLLMKNGDVYTSMKNPLEHPQSSTRNPKATRFEPGVVHRDHMHPLQKLCSSCPFGPGIPALPGGALLPQTLTSYTHAQVCRR